MPDLPAPIRLTRAAPAAAQTRRWLVFAAVLAALLVGVVLLGAAQQRARPYTARVSLYERRTHAPRPRTPRPVPARLLTQHPLDNFHLPQLGAALGALASRPLPEFPPAPALFLALCCAALPWYATHTGAPGSPRAPPSL